MIAVTPDGAILFRRPHYDIRSATPPFSLRNFLSIQSYFLPAVEDGSNAVLVCADGKEPAKTGRN
jgi:hypothetical protein